jgi:hypothetical protein
MPRKTTDLTVVPIVPGSQRLEPPNDIGVEEAIIWREIVGSMPAGWFNGASLSLLRRLCTLRVSSDQLARRLVEERRLPIMTPALRTLMAEHREETKVINALCITLRLTPRSRYSTKDTERALTKQGSTTFRPWEAR